MSDSLQACGLQHARLPCPLLFPAVCSIIFIESMMPSNHVILFCPLLLPSIFPSISVFSNESATYIKFYIIQYIFLYEIKWHIYKIIKYLATVKRSKIRSRIKIYIFTPQHGRKGGRKRKKEREERDTRMEEERMNAWTRANIMHQ